MPFKMKRARIFILLGFVAILCALIFIFYLEKSKKVVLYYSAWNLGNIEEPGLERQMIEAFMKEHPNIKIVIREDFVENYNLAMEKSVADDSIPDVFMFSGNASVEENGWCLDLAELVAKDQDWEKIPAVLTEAAYIKGKVVAIPSAIYFYGYYCNQSVLDESDLPRIQDQISVDTFIHYVKSATNITAGRLGLADAGSICEWYPAAINNRYGWFTWDGGKLNLNSHEFQKAITLEQQLNAGKYTFSLLETSEKELLQATGDWEAWNQGNIAFKFDGTWSVNAYAAISSEITFIGLPGDRVCLVPDFLFVSKNTKYPEEAYEFAKYMSAYSREGFQQRLQIAEENGFELNSLPMIDDEEIVTAFFSMIHMKGIKETYTYFIENPDKAYVEGTKVLPGYAMARWNYSTNISLADKPQATIGEIIDAAGKGNLDFEPIADEINYLANTSILMYPQQLNN